MYHMPFTVAVPMFILIFMFLLFVVLPIIFERRRK